MDVVDSLTRSRMMAGIPSKNTKPEIIVRRHLHALGFRYRLHIKSLPGSPDIVLHKYRCVIFVHGCFWHRHENCVYTTNPATNSERWYEKFRKNVERDRHNQKVLVSAGWNVITVWECELKRNFTARMEKLVLEIIEHKFD